jgi:hypothetical protein
LCIVVFLVPAFFTAFVLALFFGHIVVGSGFEVLRGEL